MQSPIYPQPAEVVTHPHIRTFHARHGRMSAKRNFALTHLLPNFEISALERPVDLPAVLGQESVIIDFGSGMGTHTLNLAKLEPQIGVLAIDVHTVGLLAVAETATELKLYNIKTHHGDGLDVLTDWLKPASISEIHVMFPDPWPKIRHHKRRLISEHFLDLAFELLKPGGRVIFATDNASYFETAFETFESFEKFRITLNDWDVPHTAYHQRALRLNHKISQLSARKV